MVGLRLEGGTVEADCNGLKTSFRKWAVVVGNLKDQPEAAVHIPRTLLRRFTEECWRLLRHGKQRGPVPSNHEKDVAFPGGGREVKAVDLILFDEDEFGIRRDGLRSGSDLKGNMVVGRARIVVDYGFDSGGGEGINFGLREITCDIAIHGSAGGVAARFKVIAEIAAKAAVHIPVPEHGPLDHIVDQRKISRPSRFVGSGEGATDRRDDETAKGSQDDKHDEEFNKSQARLDIASAVLSEMAGTHVRDRLSFLFKSDDEV